MLQDIFQAKDRVRCAVIGIDQEARQLSLSTAELENFPGEMLENKASRQMICVALQCSSKQHFSDLLLGRVICSKTCPQKMAILKALIR